jgi:hypothetical protein
VVEFLFANGTALVRALFDPGSIWDRHLPAAIFDQLIARLDQKAHTRNEAEPSALCCCDQFRNSVRLLADVIQNLAPECRRWSVHDGRQKNIGRAIVFTSDATPSIGK